MTERDQPTSTSEILPEPSPKPVVLPPSSLLGPGKQSIPAEIRQEIVRLHKFYGTRQIARRVDLTRKVVRRVLTRLLRSLEMSLG